MTPGPQKIHAVTLFTEDLGRTKAFYQEVFGLPVVFETGDSAVFRIGETLVDLLHTPSARELVAPAAVADPAAGARFQFTIAVEDVDALVANLRQHGVAILNGPMDRPWGVRTAAFRDPGGHIWEIAQDEPPQGDE